MQPREIKFRAWDKSAKKWRSDLNVVPISSMCDPLVVETIDFQQFTGLRDENGTEIYEGDILQRHRIESQFATPWIVGANSSKGINSYHYDVSNLERYLERGDVYEIVGNIYENPELLNV